MQMQMVHGLSAVRSVIDNHTKALLEAQLLGQFAANQQQVAKQGRIVIGGQRELRDRLARNHEEMDRRLRVDVMEGDTLANARDLCQ